MPTMQEVETKVGEYLISLGPDFSVTLERIGADLLYRVHKKGIFLGGYLIQPGHPGGPVLIVEGNPPEVAEEWRRIVDNIQLNLRLKFGEFPWKKAETIPDAAPTGADIVKQKAQTKTVDMDARYHEYIPRRNQIIEEWIFSGSPEELSGIVKGITERRKKVELDFGMAGLDTPLRVIRESPDYVEIRFYRFQSSAQGEVIGDVETSGKETRITVFLPDLNCVDNPMDGWGILFDELSKRQIIRQADGLQKPAAQSATVARGAGDAYKELQETNAGKYDELCKRWIQRPSTPYMNKDEFLGEYAPELLRKSFDRILSDAYSRGVIDKKPGKSGRYILKT